MADEITIRLGIEASKSGQNYRFPTTEFNADMAGDNPGEVRQDVGTSWEDINIGDAGASAIIAAINTDGTNYVELGFNPGGGDTATDLIKAGEVGLKRFPAGVTPRARANTAAVNVRFIILPV